MTTFVVGLSLSEGTFNVYVSHAFVADVSGLTVTCALTGIANKNEARSIGNKALTYFFIWYELLLVSSNKCGIDIFKRTS